MTNWLPLEEAGQYLKMGKSTIYRLAREGDLPAHRMGRAWRFDADELDEWMKQGRMVETSTGENEDGKQTKAS